MLEHAILVISDNVARCAPVLALLGDRGCRPVLLNDAEQVGSAITEDVKLVVLAGSFRFCEPSLRFFTQIRRTRQLPPLLVISTEGSETFAVSSLRAGATDYFSDPPDLDALTDSIGRLFPPPPKEEARVGLTGGEVLVGNSPTMQALRTSIRRIASSECNVLITGETGTGKELVAQLIHQNSPRSRYPLVCINCAAIPDALLESELFGYERGAFTGAQAASPGKLMTANKGTVFFDEIGDMSQLAQAKILRAIEAKEVQRLGANRRYQTDIRILAATHHNLDDLASSQSFRRDLYFRLNVGRIHLPPLRERKPDIPILVQHMIADLNRRNGNHIEGTSTQALNYLTQYSWPGNVRELKNAMERIFLIRESGTIGTEDVFGLVRPQGLLASQAAESAELCCLREVLASCKGNKSKAAERMNWSRMTLYRKMAKYGMGSENPNFAREPVSKAKLA
jgi:DNA-binding NtrC family response regulator